VFIRVHQWFRLIQRLFHFGKNMHRTFFLIITIIFLTITSGCAGPVHKAPVERDISKPAKRTPARSKIPATLRPYVIKGKKYYPIPSAYGFQQQGIASWYGKMFHGRKTSNGETYDMHGRTAAHKTLPMNTRVLVQNLENGKETIVRINDRGPFVEGRIIDLTQTAAKELGMLRNGTARVRITALGESVSLKSGSGSITRLLPHADFSKGEFYVQIGSFTVKDNAIRLKNKMEQWGKKTVIRKYDRGDRLFYRVHVQAGTTIREAKRNAEVLKKAGFPGFVVAK
jgi:rare lipoprotein A